MQRAFARTMMTQSNNGQAQSNMDGDLIMINDFSTLVHAVNCLDNVSLQDDERLKILRSIRIMTVSLDE